MSETTHNRPSAGIAFVLAGMAAISINDMLIKQLSEGYPLHQIIFTRSAIGLIFTLVLVQLEGGWAILRTAHPGLHLLRGALIVVSNMCFFVALAVIPLADATALFFAAPLFITVLSIPILGEKVGPLRIGAVLVGFAGVLIMQRPWANGEMLDASRTVLLMPVLGALTYAIMQLMTRKLGATSKASAMTVYIQMVFILVSLGFWLVAGDGRFAQDTGSPSLRFLFRAWVWPSSGDWPTLVGLGLNSAVIGYCLAQAYRLADAATVAPFEYALLPMAVFWGWLLWAELPDAAIWIGMALIVASGLFVFLREKQNKRRIARAAIKRR
ncbi:DMT family transporter [Sedimentitalea sp. JM2-8]|uniref:DMT family transporter n=1 Tax=Sedimentitalea xiamensis TaxID=3050037 RepID=A0ABT7FAT6_9RHOB|nr:DMT family transporter [Sedimentitalea xiamensis]MDK3072220.1 DMT family transporter [Sedimentitalea xiamensis]